MQKTLLFIFLSVTAMGSAQSLVQSVNAGSIIGSASSVSVGEIVVVPANPDQPNSGLIGILAQVNQQTLAVPQMELAPGIVVYPNPTVSKIFFETDQNLGNQKVSIFSDTGQLVSQKQVASDNSVDLSDLASGIYLIQLTDQNINPFKIIKY